MAIQYSPQSEISPGIDHPKLVSWMESRPSSSDVSSSWAFYSLPSDFNVAQSMAYKAGRIYGQDVSSGAAVALLMESSVKAASDAASDRILDLCCAPGLKLCAILDWLDSNRPAGQEHREVTVVGVDISEHRLDIAKNVIHKYHIDPKSSGQRSLGRAHVPRIRLYLGDGTTFGMNVHEEIPHCSLVFDSDVAREEQIHMGERKRKNKSSKARVRKRLQELDFEEFGASDSNADGLFDRVLVDAECSTDGSLKHVKKLLQDSARPSGGGIITCLSDVKKMNELLDLQKRLATRGFRLLRPGGCMVYSTCSLSERQNEDVVAHLLRSSKDAVLVPIPMEMFGESRFIKEGSLQGTLRFMPNMDSGEQYGGGFFLARVKKAKQTSGK